MSFYIAYLKNRDGEYHLGNHLHDIDDVVEFACTYGVAVPQLMVCDSGGVCILEIENGTVLFPEDLAEALAATRYRQITVPATGMEALARCTTLIPELLREAEIYDAETPDHGGLRPLMFSHPVNRLDYELQTIAAIWNLNLYNFGYRNIDIFLTDQWERPDRPVEHQ